MLKLTNTLTRTREEFHPHDSKHVTLYHCGPTVYDRVHIGNLRTFITNDILRRALEILGYSVTQVMNITDVDDKTIRRSQEQGITLSELTTRYEDIFLDDLRSVNILAPHHLPRARTYIPHMISFIEDLLTKGFAYKAEDGVYFSVAKSAGYGALAHIHLDHAQSAGRSRIDEYDKDSVGDFALWKFVTPEDGANFWPSPFGDGRPGWHIECSAMSQALLGETIDIHTGGTDLCFPHHVNEIAQSEAHTGKPFVRYWVHGAFLNLKDSKMSKSKGNILTLGTLVEEGYSPLDFRYLTLGAHYTSLLDFSFESLAASRTARRRVKDTIVKLPEGGALVSGYTERFVAALEDDINAPKVLALLHELLADPDVIDKDKKTTALYLDFFLGLELGIPDQTELSEEVLKLAHERHEARTRKDWKTSDELRAKIESYGYHVLDTPSGQHITEE
jgi:cysteinyl-tRNA synthetase